MKFDREEILALRPVRLRSEKSKAVCVIIPTCQSAAVTATTIVALYHLHREPGFEVLIIDNGGEDHKFVSQTVLREAGVQINYLAFTENLGSAGSQFVGFHHALSEGYEVLIFSDNDAMLETPEGIGQLVAALETCDLVLPANRARRGVPRQLPLESSFHYLTLGAETARKIGAPDPFFFLYGDDVEFTLRAVQLGLTICELPDVEVTHWLLKPAMLANQSRYLAARNYAYLACQSRIGLFFRVRFFVFLLLLVLVETLHGLQLKDASLPLAVLRGLGAVGMGRLDMSVRPARFSYEWWKPVGEEKFGAFDLAPLKNRILLRKLYRVPDLSGGVAYLRRVDPSD